MPATVTADGVGWTRLDPDAAHRVASGAGRICCPIRLRPLGSGLREDIVAAMIDRLVHHAEVITSMVVRDLSLMEIFEGSTLQRLAPFRRGQRDPPEFLAR